MGRKKRKGGERQLLIAPTQPAFPIIPTEVFWELNPELQEFVDEKPPQYFPSQYHYNYSTSYGYKKAPHTGCAPRLRLCIPRPCMPV